MRAARQKRARRRLTCCRTNRRQASSSVSAPAPALKARFARTHSVVAWPVVHVGVSRVRTAPGTARKPTRRATRADGVTAAEITAADVARARCRGISLRARKSSSSLPSAFITCETFVYDHDSSSAGGANRGSLGTCLERSERSISQQRGSSQDGAAQTQAKGGGAAVR